MRITAQALMMGEHHKLILADLLAFSLTNPSSPHSTTIFVPEISQYL